MSAPVKVETVEELVGLVELVALRTFEISGRRDESDGETGEDADPEVPYAINLRESHDSDGIETRFRITVNASGAELVAEVGVAYSFDQPLEVAPRAIRDFLVRVAVMAAYPFLREAVATTAARMEIPVPVLGLLKPGMIDLGEEPEGSE